MVFGIFNLKKRNAKKLVDSVGKILATELSIIKRLIPLDKRKNEIDDIFSLGYTYFLCIAFAKEIDMKKEDTMEASIGILIGLFNYTSEREQERMMNRINTCMHKNSKEFTRGKDAALDFFDEWHNNPNEIRYRWMAHIDGR